LESGIAASETATDWAIANGAIANGAIANGAIANGDVANGDVARAMATRVANAKTGEMAAESFLIPIAHGIPV
jgi:hypothetical protein